MYQRIKMRSAVRQDIDHNKIQDIQHNHSQPHDICTVQPVTTTMIYVQYNHSQLLYAIYNATTQSYNLQYN